MTDSERFLARVLYAWLDYDGGANEGAGGRHYRTAGHVSDYLEDRGLAVGTSLTSDGADLVRRLEAEEATERRAAEEAGRKLTKSEP